MVIDAAGVHKIARTVIDAANARLIRGGKLRVVSPQKDVLTPFNVLFPPDLSLTFHPAATGARFVLTPVGPG